MTFTPEESRIIAEEMLGWKLGYPFGVQELEWQDHIPDKRWDDPQGKTYAYNELPDFSQPEWTGPMLEVALRDWAHRLSFVPLNECLVVCARSGNEEIVCDGPTNRNLYDSVIWLKQQEASHA